MTIVNKRGRDRNEQSEEPKGQARGPSRSGFWLGIAALAFLTNPGPQGATDLRAALMQDNRGNLASSALAATVIIRPADYHLFTAYTISVPLVGEITTCYGAFMIARLYCPAR